MKKILIVIAVILVVSGAYIGFLYMSFSRVSTGEKIPIYGENRRALLVIDVQRDMTEKTGKAVINLNQTDEIIKKINAIIKKRDLLNLTVVYVRHEFEKNPVIKLLTGGALGPGSEGARIDPRVVIVSKNIFRKNKMDSFSNPELDSFLRKNKINHLIITGLDADGCVDRTTRGALNRGYSVTVIKDAIATGSDEKRAEKVAEFKDMGVQILSTDEFTR